MNDEEFYKTVAEELREKRINEALWTKATAKAMGDENKVRAVYIQLRVQQLMQEHWKSREVTETASAPEPLPMPSWVPQRVAVLWGPVPKAIAKGLVVAFLLWCILKIYRIR